MKTIKQFFNYLLTGKTGLEPQLLEAKQDAMKVLCQSFYQKGAINIAKNFTKEGFDNDFENLYSASMPIIKQIIK